MPSITPLVWLLLTAALGTSIGWALARRTTGSLSNWQSHAPVRSATPPWVAAVIVGVVALDAIALGLLAWSILHAAGPENIRGAVVPLTSLAGAAVIVALALGPILESIFTPIRGANEQTNEFNAVENNSSPAEQGRRAA